uniref:non-specific serine/threonine protein kinase n=1 Tax=Steinernema glaseri TaxID=37863 RepID=A0A1I8AIW9_9BILA
MEEDDYGRGGLLMEQEREDDYGRGGLPIITLGETLNQAYFVVRKLGWGNFSTVWLCWHPSHNRFYAVKIVKSDEQYTAGAREEIDGLTRASGKKEIVGFVESFSIVRDTGSHICIVTEVLGPSLLTVLKETDYQDRSPEALQSRLRMVRAVARGMLQGLAALEKCKLIHTDIKPENVLLTRSELEICDEALETLGMVLRNEELPIDAICSNSVSRRLNLNKRMKVSIRTMMTQIRRFRKQLKEPNGKRELTVKVADLGNAVHVSNRANEEIQTLQYRSPESILCAGYNYTADVFSAACTLYEMAVGDYLFDMREESNDEKERLEHLHLMALIIGDLKADHFIHGSRYNHFFENGTLRKCVDFEKDEMPRPIVNQLLDHGWHPYEAYKFAGFLLKMLRLDPARRPTAEECLELEWLTEE